tara:strand:+ start:1287 stop:1709 length:423 start_codon:yes stop_codon:yes gene_type:complete
MRIFIKTFTLSILMIFLSSCATTTARILDTEESAVKLRSIQSRAFDTTDKEKTLRTIIATMQDLSFVINKADLELGSVSGTKLKGYKLDMTVTVLPRGEKQIVVRANASLGINPIVEPEPYQDFFSSLSKAMFLEAQDVN